MYPIFKEKSNYRDFLDIRMARRPNLSGEVELNCISEACFLTPTDIYLNSYRSLIFHSRCCGFGDFEQMQNTAAFLATSHALVLTHQTEHVVWNTKTSAWLQHCKMEVTDGIHIAGTKVLRFGSGLRVWGSCGGSGLCQTLMLSDYIENLVTSRECILFRWLRVSAFS